MPSAIPRFLAQTVSTLDHISGGRITLGIGAGWPGEHRRYGIDFWRRPERMARLDQAVQIIKRLWTEDAPAFEGRYYRLDAPPRRLHNVQQPHPPLLIGGGNDAVMGTIAKYADMASPMIPIREARPKVDATCASIGRDPREIRWAGGGTLFLHDDPRVEQQAVAYAIEHYGGTEEDVRGGGLFGSADRVRDGVRKQIADGADDIIVFQLPRVHMKSLMRFSDQVIPAFV